MKNDDENELARVDRRGRSARLGTAGADAGSQRILKENGTRPPSGTSAH
jgi:hypothetical protein